MLRRPLLALIAIVPLVLACGARRPPYGDQPVDFDYRIDGVDQRLAELRGRPLVLVLIRTSELTSEVYLREVRRAYTRIGGSTRFLVLSREPGEEPLLAPFAEFQELPFSVGVAAFAVAAGQTELGTIPIVPSTYLLDHHGRVVDLAAGAVRAEAITAAVARQRWD